MGLHSHGTVTGVLNTFFKNSYSMVLSVAQISLISKVLYSNLLCINFSTTCTSVDHAFLPGALASLSLLNIFFFCGILLSFCLDLPMSPFFAIHNCSYSPSFTPINSLALGILHSWNIYY